ncbi:hypothetical protein B0H16DRAFT_1482473 [Mycena metata]|uniref:Uncharacterized protein n=1 Tax=Mycena metata TaxID=1033252 RepID=A0AAD7GT51_9AGAR|nr:hypothetical protein B0H16DRAFT_1482473 [Mycena metata]
MHSQPPGSALARPAVGSAEPGHEREQRTQLQYGGVWEEPYASWLRSPSGGGALRAGHVDASTSDARFERKMGSEPGQGIPGKGPEGSEYGPDADDGEQRIRVLPAPKGYTSKVDGQKMLSTESPPLKVRICSERR